ncbi:gram-negative bacteria-binding protein 2 isoform X1 [Zeugodacus cucurbitae]|uniref:gram-negative bacteria-binding protein 2 isoform X1 n=1 Tax=Zeugodacus cucurbitae TaxID=28588 RepID=UPI0005967AC3|nr:gram-negative bacteria-binding protein 2 isoform X1 [Zeugodacus cucurbitae]
MRFSLCCISFVWLCCYGVQNVFAYKIPQIKLELIGDKFNVSIPDEDGISMAIFNIEINEQCPVLVDMVTAQRGGFWRSEHAANKLKRNDKVKINVLVTHKDGLFSRTDSVQVSDRLTLTYETIKEAENPIDTCAANIATNLVNRETETKVKKNGKELRRIFKRDELIFEELFEKQDLPNWTYAKFIHSNAIGDQSEDFTALSKANAEVYNGKLFITPSISSKLGTNSRFNVSDCRSPACYEGSHFTCKYEKSKERAYEYPAPVNSARISTNGTFSFTYGRIEINATLPNGDWLFPYIMLMPDKLNCAMRKQIRIAFATSADLESKRLRGGPVILQARENKQSAKLYFTRLSHMAVNTNFNVDGFHNFTMVWTSQGMSWYVDRKQYACSINNGEYAEPYHIVLGVGAGGNLEFEDTTSKPWRNGYNTAFTFFHRSFTGCCARQNHRKACVQINKNNKNVKKERMCSREWGPQATMAVESVRVFAV